MSKLIDAMVALNLRKDQNNTFLIRFKREDEVIDEAELKERGKKCKDMEISSKSFGLIGDFFDDIGEALGAIPVIGKIAEGVAKVTVGASHLIKNGIDIGSTAIDCDQVPFDEIKLLINKKFNEVGRKLDKMTETLGEISKTVSITLTLVETTRKEMKEGFKNVTDTIKSVDLNTKVFNVNSYINYYEGEMKAIKGLPKEKYVRKLTDEDNVLKKLREIRTPDEFRTPLFQLSSTVNDYLEKNESNIPLHAIESILKGTQTYASVMFSLLEHHTFLANHFYNRGDFSRFNNQLNMIDNVFDKFPQDLIGNDEPLIDNAINILKRVLKNHVYDEDKLIENQKFYLRELKNKTNTLVKSAQEFIAETPENEIEISFKEGINNPGSDWKKGKYVKYALQFKQGDVYSRISKFKHFEVNQIGNPTLKMPIDNDRDRLIFRKIGNNDAQLVGILENSRTVFRDIHRDLYNAAGKSLEKDAINEVNIYMNNGANLTAIFENGRSAIHAAAQAGHDEVVKLLLRNRVDVDKRDNNGYTPLHIAAIAGRDTVVKVLIDNYADVVAKTYDDLLTPLHFASQRGFTECVKNLLRNDTVNEKDKFGFTPLHSAVNGGHKIVEAFVESFNYTNVNVYTEKERLTPLHLAVIGGDPKVVQVLMASDKLDLNVQDTKGLTPLHYAALAPVSKNTIMIVENLLGAKEKINPNIRCESNWNPLHFALNNRNTDFVLKMLKFQNIDLSSRVDKNYSLLHIATATGQIEVIKELLKRGISIEERTDEGYTALHLGAMRKEPGIVPMLIGKGELVRSQTNIGSTPLHYAAAAGRNETVLYLLDWGASIIQENFAGRLPIHEAVSRGHLEVTKILLDENFDTVYSFDKVDKTPFDLAAEHTPTYTDIIHELVERGLNLNVWYGEQRPPLNIFAKIGNLEMVKYLLSKGANPNAVDFEEKNFFDLAAEKGHINIVEYVFRNKTIDLSKIEQGVCRAIEYGQLDVVKYFAAQREMLCDPLQTAALKGQLHIVEYLVEKVGIHVDAMKNQQTALCNAVKGGHYKIVQYLVDKRASVYGDCSLSSKKYTSVIYATENNQIEEFKLLINSLPDPNKQDNFENTPLYYASMFECLECVKYLIEEKKVNVNATNSDGNTALHAAMEVGNARIINFLSKYKADREVKNRNGEIPIDRLIWFMKEINPSLDNIDVDSEEYKEIKSQASFPSRSQYGYRFRRNASFSHNIHSSTGLKFHTSLKPAITQTKSSMSDFGKDFQERLLLYRGGSEITGYSGIRNIDLNGTLLLFDILLRKLTGEKYASVRDPGKEMHARANALLITEDIENYLTSSVDSQVLEEIDFSKMHSSIYKALVSGKGDEITDIIHGFLQNTNTRKIDVI